MSAELPHLGANLASTPAFLGLLYEKCLFAERTRQLWGGCVCLKETRENFKSLNTKTALSRSSTQDCLSCWSPKRHRSIRSTKALFDRFGVWGMELWCDLLQISLMVGDGWVRGAKNLGVMSQLQWSAIMPRSLHTPWQTRVIACRFLPRFIDITAFRIESLRWWLSVPLHSASLL